MGYSSYPREGGTMANLAETVKKLEQERGQMVGQVRKLDKAIVVLRKLAKGNSVSVSPKLLGVLV